MSRLDHAASAPAAESSDVQRPLTARPKTLGKIKSRSTLAQIKRASRIGRQLAGVSQRDLATALDTKRVIVAHFELDHQPRSPNAEHLSNANAPRSWRMEVLRAIADASRATVIDQPEIVHGDNHFARLAAVTAETTDVPRAIAAAHADGMLCDGDLGTIRREEREAIAALLELDAWCANELTARRAARGR